MFKSKKEREVLREDLNARYTSLMLLLSDAIKDYGVFREAKVSISEFLSELEELTEVEQYILHSSIPGSRTQQRYRASFIAQKGALSLLLKNYNEIDFKLNLLLYKTVEFRKEILRSGIMLGDSPILEPIRVIEQSRVHWDLSISFVGPLVSELNREFAQIKTLNQKYLAEKYEPALASSNASGATAYSYREFLNKLTKFDESLLQINNLFLDIETTAIMENLERELIMFEDLEKYLTLTAAYYYKYLGLYLSYSIDDYDEAIAFKYRDAIQDEVETVTSQVAEKQQKMISNLARLVEKFNFEINNRVYELDIKNLLYQEQQKMFDLFVANFNKVKQASANLSTLKLAAEMIKEEAAVLQRRIAHYNLNVDFEAKERLSYIRITFGKEEFNELNEDTIKNFTDGVTDFIKEFKVFLEYLKEDIVRIEQLSPNQAQWRMKTIAEIEDSLKQFEELIVDFETLAILEGN